MEPKRVEVAGTITPVMLRSCGPILSEQDVASFESRLRYKLPQDYREFLLKYNGGSPVVGDVVGRDDDPDIPYEHGDAIDHFVKLPAGNAKVEDYEVLRTPAEIGWDVPDYILPIACDAGGNCFVLEVGRGQGLVRFLDHESLEDRPIARRRVLADSFLDLLLRVVSVEEKTAIRKLELESERKALAVGEFPRKLDAHCRVVEDAYPEIRSWIRAICLKLFDQKGHFAVHDDDLSRTVIDLMFWLYQSARGDAIWIKPTELATMIHCWWQDQDGGFGLRGHAPDFLRQWWTHRFAIGALEGTSEGARLTSEAVDRVIRYLKGIESEF
jgi:hypothetical protein